MSSQPVVGVIRWHTMAGDKGYGRCVVAIVLLPNGFEHFGWYCFSEAEVYNGTYTHTFWPVIYRLKQELLHYVKTGAKL